MSRFLSKATSILQPYTPGEQPQAMRYIKLNTNESPYPPSPRVEAAIHQVDCAGLRLYPDPDVTTLREAMARHYSLTQEQVFVGGGSDEVLGYAFMAFFDRGDKVYFPSITYGFYKVYADLFHLRSVEIPLESDFSVNVDTFLGLDGNLFLANPNAPTGICLDVAQIEKIVQRNRNRLVVIDEAYIDFAPGQSCVGLIGKYDNLLVVQTFSKSRALAGMRIGSAFGHPDLIAGLSRIKYSFNPYNMDRISIAAGIAAMGDEVYFKEITGKIIATRERIRTQLTAMNFTVLPSQSNFLFVRPHTISSGALYVQLKENGVLVRFFNKPVICEYLRVTIGTDDEMDEFLQILRRILPCA